MLLCLLPGALVAERALAVEPVARVQTFVAQGWLDDDDVVARLGTDRPLDGAADLRLMFTTGEGRWRGTWHHALSLQAGDSQALLSTLERSFPVLQGGTGLTIDPGRDDDTLLDLAGSLDAGDRHQVRHRVDRLNVRYTAEDWNVVIGREAVSYGGGLVFHPMDLLNPFTPSAVDKDFKPGADLLLVQHRLQAGNELSFLAVGRRDPEGRATVDASSLAVRYFAGIGDGEVELLAGRHRDDTVLALGLRWPIGGALVRSDLVATTVRAGSVDHPADANGGDREIRVSGLLNADYSLEVGGKPAHVFAEYFHNGFGMHRLLPEAGVSTALARRLANGEVHVLMRDYLAYGGSISWHPLVSQSLVVVTNLDDGSAFLQSTLTVDLSDRQRLDIGILLQTGHTGDEFGGRPLLRLPDNDLITAGSGHRAYLRWIWYPAVSS